MDEVIVTTAGRTDNVMIQQAQSIASELELQYVHRRKESIQLIQRKYNDDCLIVGKERLELYPLGEDKPFFFHPNSSMFRIKRLMTGETDPFIEATQLDEGKSLLDCTLGLASDSIVASFMVGQNGKVVGIEGNRYLAFLVSRGLKSWDSNIETINRAMRQIEVVNGMSIDYLRNAESNSFDCVYLDPMFEEHILESDGIKALRRFALYEEMTEELNSLVKRVARERVVLKDHFRSSRFEKFGFQVNIRKTAKFHFGVWTK